MDGILNVYKEKGYTSHDVVAKLRKIVGQKKIGHTGTLDPEAEGVLPVCLGRATKLCDLLTDKKKTYRAEMLLGQITDTQDTTGTILETREVAVTEEQVIEAVKSFEGDYAQIPPMYSALKVDGKKLYELAREGKSVERKPRQVTIFKISVESMEMPRVTMKVTCSKGTYIRTLCQDIGEKLGCGACMESLLRENVSGFDWKDSLKLARIERLQAEGKLEQALVPIEDMFAAYPAVRVSKDGEKLLKNGNPLEKSQIVPEQQDGGSEGEIFNGRLRVRDNQGLFCAVYEYREDRKKFLPVKMFL